MNRAVPFAAVIFDLDGLVVDSEAGYFLAWQQAAALMGFELSPSFCASLSGAHGAIIRQRLLTQLGEHFDLERFNQLSGQLWCEQVAQQGIPVRPGFHTLLDYIQQRQLPYALATNSRLRDVKQCLSFAGLDDVFPLIVSRDDVDNPKPAPDVFMQAARALATGPAQCLVLEDSAIGLTAAVAASCPCILVPSCASIDAQVLRQAVAVLPDLAAVADFISGVSDHPL